MLQAANAAFINKNVKSQRKTTYMLRTVEESHCVCTMLCINLPNYDSGKILQTLICHK